MPIMKIWENKLFRHGILGVLVFIFLLLALWIRSLPFPELAGTGNMIAGPDAWYNLRLIEVALANNFGFIYFEPMTLYPTGQEIVWGPLFTWIASAIVVFAGAGTRPEIIDAAGWVPALMGAAMVPIMYWFGSRIGNWRTGLISALFIAVIGGQYLSRSLYGHLDHHIAETLFSTLFCLLYVVALYALKEHKINFKEYTTLKLPILYGVICGITYLLGLLTMPTIVVFGLFVAIFTLLQFIIDHHSEQRTEYLLVLNVVTYTIVLLGLLGYGIRNMGFGYASYSLGLFCAHVGIVFGTIILYLISRYIIKKDLKWHYYPVSLLVLCYSNCLSRSIFRHNWLSQRLLRHNRSPVHNRRDGGMDSGGSGQFLRMGSPVSRGRVHLPTIPCMETRRAGGTLCSDLVGTDDLCHHAARTLGVLRGSKHRPACRSVCGMDHHLC